MEPPVGAESGPFWEATREGTLLVQWCTSCDRGIFYPRFFCPYCAADGPGDSGRTGQSEPVGPVRRVDVGMAHGQRSGHRPCGHD